jgi:hypothetical protein
VQRLEVRCSQGRATVFAVYSCNKKAQPLGWA